MPNEAIIEIEQTLAGQFKGLDAESKEATAELWKRSDLNEIIQKILEAKTPAVLDVKRYRILQAVSNVFWRSLPIGTATEVVVDTIGKCVARSAAGASSEVSELQKQLEGIGQMEPLDSGRTNIAALLDLPSLKDAVRAVAEHQRISSDPANRLPEKITLDGRGGFSLEIPRHDY